MAYHSKYSGAEVDALLDKIKDDEVGSIDSSLSTTSENPVKNKVITEELNKKVDKVEGKQLSTEDFTSELKTKLDGLSNYDDTKVKGDLAVLKGTVVGKQDVIPDLDSIRSGADKGSTSIQEHQDISHLLPKSEFEAYTTETDTEIATLESQIENEATARTNADAKLQTQINGKQEALTLTVKNNGNIVLANIQGQSKEFMPATPSGDPMHYAYVAAGAEYNDTGADIVKTTPWADMIDDDYDGDYGKTVIHKAGYWYLNGLGDITTNEIREIYSWIGYTRVTYGYATYGHFMDFPLRTNFYFENRKPTTGINVSYFLRASKLVVAGIGDLKLMNCGQFLYGNITTKHILGILYFLGKLDIHGFVSARELKTIKAAGLRDNFRIPQSLNLSSKSILYMITNEAATSAITITLHADAYSRAMADAEILAALETHTNVSLASA